jgi:hypothetical protein
MNHIKIKRAKKRKGKKENSQPQFSRGAIKFERRQNVLIEGNYPI